MSPTAIKTLGVAVVSVVLSIALGYFIASGDYFNLIIFTLLCGLIITVIAPGYSALLAFGILCPFVVPLPGIYALPFICLILGLCWVKYLLRRGLNKRADRSYVSSLNFWFSIFFLWVAIRYSISPVAPGIAIGKGEAVTGFRAYFTYAFTFILVVGLGFFCPGHQEIYSVVKWMGIFSAGFIVLFIPLIFTKSLMVAAVLGELGQFVTFFDNGWLRFVSLAGFGSTLIELALLRTLMPVPRFWRVLVFVLGTAAVVMGGNRGSFVMILVIIVSIIFFQRRYLLAIFAIVFTSLILLLFNFIGESYHFDRGVGFFRILSLVSTRVAEMTDAADNVRWRQVRWERALQDVYASPIFGVGYGGLGRAFIYSDAMQYESARVEIDVASGTIHNGFISGARALGVPALLLFMWLWVSQVFLQGRQALRYRGTDEFKSDLHSFTAANLLSLAPAIYIGSDLNQPIIWFYLGIGVVLSRLHVKSQSQPAISGAAARPAIAPNRPAIAEVTA